MTKPIDTAAFNIQLNNAKPANKCVEDYYFFINELKRMAEIINEHFLPGKEIYEIQESKSHIQRLSLDMHETHKHMGDLDRKIKEIENRINEHVIPKIEKKDKDFDICNKNAKYLDALNKLKIIQNTAQCIQQDLTELEN